MVVPRPLQKNQFFVSFSQFGASFSFNFADILLPFFILRISPYPLQDTLLWIGVIIGSSGVCTAITSTFWGSLAHYFSPKSLYLRGIIAHSIAYFLMGLTTNLYILLILRIFQGLLGGISTIGLIIISSSSSKERMSVDIGIFQSMMTLGMLIGPPIGSLVAGILDFKGAFLSASVILFATFLFCYLNVTEIPQLPREKKLFDWTHIDKRLIIGWMLCFTAQIQLMFLPSILPNVFDKFNIEQNIALKLAGAVVMFYTATAMIGTYIWSSLSRKFGLYRVITVLFASGIFFQLLLAFSRGIIDFTVIRMIQTGMVAATIPLTISIFASEPKGTTIGFLNSARFVGNALGPIIATSILAFSNLMNLYFFISVITLCAFLSFKFFFK